VTARRLLAFIAAAFLAAAQSPAADFAGACITVHGRLAQSNGSPSYRLWKIGSKRILGVVDCRGRDESKEAIPASVLAIAGPNVEHRVIGDFEVCPLTVEAPGRMQRVCIRSASHLTLEKMP
jgi:hypothetical protein